MLLRKTTWFWKSGLAAISFVRGHGYTRIYAYGRIDVFESGNSRGKRR